MVKINNQEAIEIATNFAIKEYDESCSGFSLCLTDVNARLEKDGFGHKFLGMGESYWSILFQLKSTDLDLNEAVLCPDHVIVLVDSTTGKAVWFPRM